MNSIVSAFLVTEHLSDSPVAKNIAAGLPAALGLAFVLLAALLLLCLFKKGLDNRLASPPTIPRHKRKGFGARVQRKIKRQRNIEKAG